MRTLLNLPNLAVVHSRQWLLRVDRASRTSTWQLRSPSRAAYLAVLLEDGRRWS